MAKKGADGMRIDLGGIGKGYALDQVADFLKDWDIDNALLSAGGSTVHAIGSAPDSNSGWPVNAGPPGSDPVQLRDGLALSGSGFEVQGAHIIDPRTGRPCPENESDRPIIWAVSPGAALADALLHCFYDHDSQASGDILQETARSESHLFRRLMIHWIAGLSRR